MTMFDASLLLDPPAWPAAGYAGLADRIGRLLGTRGDVIFVQAEAVVALEAVASSLAAPSLKVLNIVTSPYGGLFGGWLRRGGAQVTDLVAEPARPVTVEAVKAALDAGGRVDAIALVHAESASGILNPLEGIAALAKARGSLLVVDAVASVGGHPLDVDALGIDIAVIGPQKALAGPAGVSAVSVSAKAWALIDRPGAPVDSVLSLLDQKRGWLDTGRGALPGTPPALEFHALDAALARIEQEGLENVLHRHAAAAAEARAGLAALGLEPFETGERASNLVTAVALPDAVDLGRLTALDIAVKAELTAGVGPGAERLVRINHTGRRADPAIVRATLAALAQALHRVGR
ncbi:aminotransferase class V-fold PLP-dependent enzyme [Rhizobiaceae bacterium BDR2-2]|uniref:Aminotransferase class V-fold PLP-dependent enzyme n=1 Tax=Ectorhizobium quercum TaxID=2965071 RepID=A0AAE3MW77_9HYPH|nr:aminotransferase class V-fold PLP-dependent enzyme [Ectorhizobium quercum]MCX8996019.1 aminotransferase class V-fold PLP-dependent enzyme [Ectorhizobium quercum]